MVKQVKARLSVLLRWPEGGKMSRRARRARAGRAGRFCDLACETLEGRVVLSGWGVDLLDGLSSVGVVPSVTINVPNIPNRPWGGGGPGGPWGSQDSSSSSQLGIDLQQYQTDLQLLAAKSQVTLADLNSLNSDNQAIAQAGFSFDPQSLHTATYQLATAVVSGNDTTEAQTNFSAQFSGSSVSQTVIDKATTDVVQTIKDSKITAADLTTIAADQSAIETDLGSLPDSIEFPSQGTGGNNALLSSLAGLGIITNAKVPSGPTNTTPGSGGAGTLESRVAQLNTDLDKLQTELKSLLAKSGVTLSDLNNLNTDSQAIAKAGFVFSGQALPKAVSELATAVVNGGATTQTQSDFNALFSGSNVTQSVIDKTYEDLIQTIEDSKVTSSDLSTVAADQAAVQTDEADLHQTPPDQNGLPPFAVVTGGAAGAANSLSNSDSGSTTGTGTGTSGSSGTTGSSNGRPAGRFRARTFFRSRHR